MSLQVLLGLLVLQENPVDLENLEPLDYLETYVYSKTKLCNLIFSQESLPKLLASLSLHHPAK